MTDKRAVILLSGGLDSATVVAMAKADGYQCYTMSFDYGQRHRAELNAAARVARDLGVVEHGGEERHHLVRLVRPVAVDRDRTPPPPGPQGGALELSALRPR